MRQHVPYQLAKFLLQGEVHQTTVIFLAQEIPTPYKRKKVWSILENNIVVFISMEKFM